MKRKKTEKNSTKERKLFPNRSSQNCLDCSAHCKLILESNQTNQNAKNYKSETRSIKVLIRVEIHQELQHNSFIHSCMFTIGLYLKSLFEKNSTFVGLPEQK